MKIILVCDSVLDNSLQKWMEAKIGAFWVYKPDMIKHWLTMFYVHYCKAGKLCQFVFKFKTIPINVIVSGTSYPKASDTIYPTDAILSHILFNIWPLYMMPKHLHGFIHWQCIKMHDAYCLKLDTFTWTVFFCFVFCIKKMLYSLKVLHIL